MYSTSGRGVINVLEITADKVTILAENKMPDNVYATPAIADGVIYVRFDSENKYAGPSSWFARHDYPKTNERQWGTWTLDYHRRSDLDDSVGYWRVMPLEDDPEHSLVIYSATLKLKSKVPGFIVGIIVKARLKQATVWVKEQSEARMAKAEAEL